MEPLRFGMSSCGAQDLTEKDFEQFAQAGVKELELSFASKRYDSLQWSDIKKRADEYGVHLWSFHLPFMPFDKINIADCDRKVREYSVAHSEELIKKAADIGIKMMVIHPSGEPNAEEKRQEAMKNAQESLAHIAEVAAQCDATVAVENLPRTCLGRNSAEIKRLISVDERLKVCFDTNHLLSQPTKEFILEVGEKIITTHFSDYDFVDEKHWLPGEGLIDWKELIETLEQIGYSGPILYELGFAPKASIDRRMLNCDDFRINHYLLKNKLPIQAIGKPVINREG